MLRTIDLILCLLLLTSVMLASYAADADKGAFGKATVALFAKAPVIDGVLSPGEWDGAVRTSDFVNLFPTKEYPNCGLDARRGTTYFGYTNDRLYIAMVSEYPPDGKSHSSGVTRDADYVYDESIEIWLDPNREHRASAQGDQRFYQMNFNAAGGVYDISFDPKTGPNVGWNGHWEIKSTVDQEKHIWTAELSLPFADLGWEAGKVIGKHLGVLIARNYKGPWTQPTWFPVHGAFVDWYRYADIQLTPDAPTVQISSLGDKIFTGQVDLKASVFNPGAARQAKVKTHITSSDMPEFNDEKTLALPAGGTASYAVSLPNGRLHEAAQHQLTLTVTSPDEQETYLRYATPWTQAPEKKWYYRLGADPDSAVRFAYYPSYKFVRVLVSPGELGKEFDAVREAHLTITDSANKPVLEQALSWKDAPTAQEFPVGDLPDSTYRLTVTIPGWKEPFVRTFTRKHFPWEGNTLGITDDVLPPFTPIAVHGRQLGVVGRQYTVNGLGLWEQARSLERDLLAAPIALVADGKDTLRGKGAFTTTKPNLAVYEGKATHPAVTVTSRCTTEVDGCMKVELTLAPGTRNKELQSLWLDIPLKDHEAPLWHVTTTSLRINPAGKTPAGDGNVWDSRQFPDGNWYGNMKCYLWLGADERGLSWFADNDRGWVLDVNEKDPDKSVPAQQLIRSNGVLTLRVNLVQKPILLTEPRTLVFGLMVSPGKPMAANWRRIGITDSSVFNMGYANPATYCAKMPWGNDFSIADWAYQQRTGKGGPSAADLAAYKARNFPLDMDPKFREGAINLALGPFLGSFRPGEKYYKMYFEEYHTTSQAQPESPVFQSEWTGYWYGQLLDHVVKEEQKSAGIGTGGIVASYRDFACWYAAQWVKRGIGCYFDNAFPQRAFDTLTTSAYRLPDGRVQPSAGIWARREYMKRIWTIHRTLAPADALPAMMIHMTNTHIIPYMTWNDENLDLEWKFGPEPQQSKYPYDFLRAESAGRQSGNVPYVLANISDTKTKAEADQIERTRFGTMMVHEIRYPIPGPGNVGLFKVLTDFGYGQDDCKVFNYWQQDYPVNAGDPNVKSLLLERGKELLLLVCTWNPQPGNATFTLNTKTLGFSPTSAVNEEKKDEGYGYDVKNNTFSLPLEGYGVRMVRIK